jgi:ABC-2 type transport system ATP-binding protein
MNLSERAETTSPTTVATTGPAARPPSRRTPELPTAQTPGPAIETHDLHKAFGPIKAVDGIDLSFPPGRIYGLLGPNGSGKTTLIRLMAGLAVATSGTVTVLGTTMPSRPLLARIGYMTQSDGLYSELSVWENLSFFAAMSGQRDEAALAEILELVELGDRRGTPILELSGGMRRRLSLACALVHRPTVVFLDEPTVGVDPVLRFQLWDHFRRLATAGTTLVVSSHVMDEGDRCDELILIRSGRVLASGSGAAIRQQAGTPDLESAFLKLSGVPGRTHAGGTDAGTTEAGRSNPE